MRALPLLILAGCTPLLNLDGPTRICPDDACVEAPGSDATVVETDCDGPCARLAACAMAGCTGAVTDFEAQCEDRCHSVAGVAQTLAEAEDCATVLDTGAPLLVSRCLGERCDRFGDRLTGCIVAECTAAGQVFEGLRAVLKVDCAAQVEAGALRLATLDTLDSNACEASAWADRVSVEVADDGVLGPVCTEGPATDRVVCEAACERAVTCLDGEEASCLFTCATQPEGAALAECLADVSDEEGCAGAQACAD